MKKLTLTLVLGFGFLLASAQENVDNDRISTILSKDRHNGGYGAVSFSYTQIDGKDAFLVGARGSWIIDHSFAIGLGGCGFINDLNYHNMMDNTRKNLAGGYGGIYLEPIIAPRLPVHLSFPVLLGIGGITNIEDHTNIHNDWVFDSSKNDVFLVFEPSVELEVNMTQHLRIAGTIGYRITSDIKLENTNPNILKGFNFGVILKFGRF